MPSKANSNPVDDPDPYEWETRPQDEGESGGDKDDTDPYDWKTRPQDEGGPGGEKSGPWGTYFKDLHKQIKDYLQPMRDYYTDALDAAKSTREAAAAQAELLNRLREPGGTEAAISSSLEQPFGALKSKAEGLRSGTGFLSQFIKQTKADLADRKIPQSPRKDLGEPAGLKQRVNTKGFYR